MTQFEFLAVFISIIFGLSLTQILSGAIYLAQRRQLVLSHLGWTIFILMVLALDWWTFWPWSTNAVWTFAEFFVVLLWALSHYVMASALYPSRSLEGHVFAEERRSVAIAVVVVCLMDMAQTAARGDLFNPWYYSLFLGAMMVVAATGLVTANETVHRVIPWTLVAFILSWSFIERFFI